MAATQAPEVTIENARILFRNFSGAERKYNALGDRNFAVALTPELAQQLSQLGFNVKTRAPREEGDEPLVFVQVKVSYTGRPPRVVLITSRRRTELTEDLVPMLDAADIRNVDLILRGWEYNINGNTGVSCYLKTMYVTINEDDLDLKYSDPEMDD